MKLVYSIQFLCNFYSNGNKMYVWSLGLFECVLIHPARRLATDLLFISFESFVCTQNPWKEQVYFCKILETVDGKNS